MNLYRIGWYEFANDPRPITYPPQAPILAWWCSGARCSDWASVMIAYVEAESEEEAKAAIIADWPLINEADKEWNFCEQKDVYIPSERFSEKDWMKPRLEKWARKQQE